MYVLYQMLTLQMTASGPNQTKTTPAWKLLVIFPFFWSRWSCTLSYESRLKALL